MIIRVISTTWFIINQLRLKQAAKSFSDNILLVKPGMDIAEARLLMEEERFKQVFTPKLSYQLTDSVAIICLKYIDEDASDGYPLIKFNPTTKKVVSVRLGIVY